MRDIYDAIEAPQNALDEAIRLDPTFAAAHLRRAFVLQRPSSAHAYLQAVRYRDRLDARDQALLEAEAPCDAPAVPDYVECRRRFAVLAQARPFDSEIRLRLIRLDGIAQGGSELAEEQELLRIDPQMAGAEYRLGYSLFRLGSIDESLAHLRRCQELSPVAALCILMQGRVEAIGGRCNTFAAAAARAAAIVPNDEFDVLAQLSAVLTTDGSRAAATAQLDRLRALNPRMADFHRGSVAMWFGDFSSAYDAFAAFAERSKEDGPQIPLEYAQFVAAEEMGDQKKMAAFLERYLAGRAANLQMPMEAAGYPDVMRALGARGALPQAILKPSTESLGADAAGQTSNEGWYDPRYAWLRDAAERALSPDEARAALALPAAAGMTEPLLATDYAAEYEFGRVLLLAGRPQDAAPHLERVTQTCEPFPGLVYGIDVSVVTRASLDLGRAREAVGDVAGACQAYGRVLERWGSAKPRSVTAEQARARAKALGCR